MRIIDNFKIKIDWIHHEIPFFKEALKGNYFEFLY